MIEYFNDTSSLDQETRQFIEESTPRTEKIKSEIEHLLCSIEREPAKEKCVQIVSLVDEFYEICNE